MKITYDMIETDERYAILAEILREAGFQVKKNSTGNIGVKLTTPLVFPPPRRGKRS